MKGMNASLRPVSDEDFTLSAIFRTGASKVGDAAYSPAALKWMLSVLSEYESRPLTVQPLGVPVPQAARAAMSTTLVTEAESPSENNAAEKDRKDFDMTWVL